MITTRSNPKRYASARLTSSSMKSQNGGWKKLVDSLTKKKRLFLGQRKLLKNCVIVWRRMVKKGKAWMKNLISFPD